MSIGHFSVTVDLWSLVVGPVIVEDLDIRDVHVRLERNAELQANWETGSASDTSAQKGEFNPELIAFKEVRVQDVQFTFADPARRRPLNVTLDHLTVNPDENNILDLDLRGMINEIPLWADGKLGPWENLIDGKEIMIDLDLTDEVRAIHTPGHTPGHMSVLVASQGQRAIIEGDVLVHPAQVTHEHWNCHFDVDHDLATATRTSPLDPAEADSATVVACHFPAPGFGRVVRYEGKRYWQVGVYSQRATPPDGSAGDKEEVARG